MNQSTSISLSISPPEDSSDCALDLVPRLIGQGYTSEAMASRRDWITDRTGSKLDHVGATSVSGLDMRGNIENPLGAAQTPLGVAGPLLVNGECAQGVFYIPLATSEGALVRSYERGMAVLSRAGGVTTRICIDANLVSPVFYFEDVAAACDFARTLPNDIHLLREQAESTTRHGRLLSIECCPIGRQVIVTFVYYTADAHGMNMIVKATEHVSRWASKHYGARKFCLFSGHCAEKRASGVLFRGGKGKKVIAGACIPASIVKAYLHTSPADLCDVWRQSLLAHTHAHAVGFNAHFANGLAAIFIACGQDVANVSNAAVGLTDFEVTNKGDLYASVTLPSLTVGTVGGGTGLGTGRECLEMLGCWGNGKAGRFAEIVAAALLAGELSMGSAIASGEFVEAHEAYGRNRPPESR